MVIDQVKSVLARHPEVRLAILFGSQATGRARLDSDVDAAVLCDGPMDAPHKMAMIAELADATGRAVDLIDLATVGEPMLGQVLQHGKRLQGTDEAYARLLSRHLLDAADFMPYVDRILAERRQAWIGS